MSKPDAAGPQTQLLLSNEAIVAMIGEREIKIAALTVQNHRLMVEVVRLRERAAACKCVPSIAPVIPIRPPDGGDGSPKE